MDSTICLISCVDDPKPDSIQYKSAWKIQAFWRKKRQAAGRKKMHRLLEGDGEVYVNWWCYMRKFITEHLQLLNLVQAKAGAAKAGLTGQKLKEAEQKVKIAEQKVKEIEKMSEEELEKTGKRQIKENKFIYPTLDKWTRNFTSIKYTSYKPEDCVLCGEDRMNTATKAQDVILAKFTEWLVKLANDRQMFTTENIFNPGIPRIDIVKGTKTLRLDLKDKHTSEGEIQARDDSVKYIMEEGRKILSERGDATEFWFEINEKYSWLLAGKLNENI
jgi:hypothetical protein